MALGRAFSVAVRGLDGDVVEIEADITAGLPGFHLVGLPDAAVDAGGRPTTDPAHAVSLLPFGAHKGYGLALLNEVVAALIGAAVWGLVFALSRYVSLASIALGVSLPLTCWLLPLATSLRFGPAEFWFAAAIAAFNVWTHRSNIGRLLRGEENRFERKEPQA